MKKREETEMKVIVNTRKVIGNYTKVEKEKNLCKFGTCG